MSEVEKMYENAEPDRNCNLYKHFTECPMKHTQCEDCENFVFPPFTAEKQLNIIKLISKQGQIIIENWEEDNRGFNVTFRANSNLRYITMDCITRRTVEEAIAQIINDLWQDLTEEERKRIRGILE